jgi:Fuc2NAc and GlcNAc transferase
LIGLSAFVVFVASLALCAAARWYALRARIIDHPTTRSSHARPTARGGGVGFVVAYLIAVPALHAAGMLAVELMIALVGAGAIVSMIGFADDHRHVPAHYRLLVHVIAAVWLTYWLGLPSASDVFRGTASWPDWLSAILVMLYVLWIINLYNFMDGIDGLASVEAVTVGLGSALLAYLTFPDQEFWIPPLFLAAAVAGFFYFNLPPARIFMGDVGSGFLGASLAALTVYWLSHAPPLFWSATILLGAFVVDATVTLLRRLGRGERVYDAHRSHAYQHAARRFGHKAVTYAIGLVNVIWLLPIAWLISSSRVSLAVGLIVAYAPLAAAAVYFDAGGHRDAAAAN